MAQSQQTVEELYDCYTKTAANIISYYEGNEQKSMLNKLREIVKKNCIQDKKLKSVEGTKNQLMSLYNDNDDIESIIREHKKAMSEINIDMLNEEKLLEFDRQVEALLDKEHTEGDDDGTELQLTGGYINVIDPITKNRIVDPVKNTVCGHTYDRQSITELLKMNKNTRCPVVGCKSTDFVTLANLRSDVVTKTYLEKHPA
ncbi:E3 SUMO-protein ligase NSE2-like isoform X1 [Hylaeus volcanicus]|uniref:E3 SUMO-protein ligase NSE2-like isoform X1 n=2 Tax=Hylaeus volcanicus TaxID=313075 RepID=UPI0023B7BCA3|nr:E3 SUMO-protein ligase NSE2-like isoform X1 [Hylaeus volcanicus]